MANPASRKSSDRRSNKDAAPKASSASKQKPSRITRTIRGYDRKAVDALLRQKENEIAEVQGQLHHNKVLLDQAQSERAAFLRSLDVAARSADELVQEANANATKIRIEAEEEAERLRRAAHDEATEIVAVSKADTSELIAKVEADKVALANYQTELSAYLFQLGQYLMETSADPTIALPLEEQPALTGVPLESDDTIVLAEIEAAVEEDFAEFFSDDIEQDKSRDWILKD